MSNLDQHLCDEFDVDGFWKEPEREEKKRKGSVLGLDQILQGKRKRERRNARAERESKRLETELCSQSSLELSEQIIDSQLQNQVREMEEQAERLLSGLEQDDRAPPLYHVVMQEPSGISRKQKDLLRLKKSLEAEFIPIKDASSQESDMMLMLLQSGWVGNIPFNQKIGSKRIFEWLFQTVAFHADEKAVLSAFEALCKLTGTPESGALSLACDPQLQLVLDSEAHPAISDRMRGWFPSMDDLVDAIIHLGYCGAFSKDTKNTEEQSGCWIDKALFSSAEGELKSYDKQKQMVAEWMGRERLPANLLYLILFTPILVEQNKYDPCTGRLVLIYIELMLDCRATPLLPHLSMAVKCLLASFPEDEWLAIRRQLALSIVTIGPSHAGTLQAIKLLPLADSRANYLKSIASVGLVARIMDRQSDVTKHPQEKSVSIILDMLPSPRNMVEEAKQNKFPDFAALCTIVDCTDLLMHQLCSQVDTYNKKDMDKWIDFLKTTGRHVKRGNLLASNRLKLLVTELLTAYEYIRNKRPKTGLQ